MPKQIEGSARRGIQSVEIGMRLIEVLVDGGGPLLLRDLAQRAGLPASNCHRYCVSFVRTGFLSQDDQGRYDLGPRLLRAGLSVLARVDAVAVATEALVQSVEETGHTGQLSIWSEQGPIAIRWLPGRMAVRTSLSTGSLLPLLSSATGRVFLAHLPERQTRALVAREAMASGGDVEALARQVRIAGYAQVAGDHIPGLSAISAPILDAYGVAAAAITLVAAREGIAAGSVERLLSAAAVASGRLGWQGETSLSA